MKNTLAKCTSRMPVFFTSMEAVEIYLQGICLLVVCLYWPPCERKNKLSNGIFLDDFLEILSRYCTCVGDLVVLGGLIKILMIQLITPSLTFMHCITMVFP